MANFSVKLVDSSQAGVPIVIVPAGTLNVNCVTAAPGTHGVACRIMPVGSAGIPVTGISVSAPALSTTSLNANIILSNNNLTASLTDGTPQDVVGLADTAITAGQKVRFEFHVDSISTRVAFGVGLASAGLGNSAFLGSVGGNDIGYFSDGAGVWENGSQLANIAGFNAGDVIDVDVDFNGGTVAWYVNGAPQSTQTHGLVGSLFPAYGLRGNSVAASQVTLRTPGNFSFAPPVGFTEYGA